jgi:polysaccharide export outer membrane protein
MRRLLSAAPALALLFVLSPLSAQNAANAPAAPAAPPALGAPASGEYKLGPKDLLEVRVLEVPEMNVERRVSESGKLDLPLLGEVDVLGLTATAARDRISNLLTAKYVNRANVSVVVKEYAAKPVSVLGAVNKPGSLQISGRWDLQQALLAAGGLTANAGRKIYVLRHAENGLSDRLEVDTADLFQRATPQWNVPIYPSDVVNVPTKTAIKVFCLGELKAPGAYEFDPEDRVTLLAAIAKAGGLTDRAARGTIRIKRHEADGSERELKADYKRIVKGKDKDPALQADDVVVVKESVF